MHGFLSAPSCRKQPVSQEKHLKNRQPGGRNPIRVPTRRVRSSIITAALYRTYVALQLGCKLTCALHDAPTTALVLSAVWVGCLPFLLLSQRAKCHVAHRHRSRGATKRQGGKAAIRKKKLGQRGRVHSSMQSFEEERYEHLVGAEVYLLRVRNTEQ